MTLLNIKYGTLLATAFTLYVVATKYIFDLVYATTTNVIDELFHIPQGIAYCNQDFSYWDNKITTLPGLYLITAPVGLFLECNTYNLRMVNFVGSCINLLLLASILKYVYNTEDQKKVIVQAINLAILPPLYFFSHIYYTDTWSLTFLLIYSRLCIGNAHYSLVFISGLATVLMRQTNVAWIGMMFMQKFLDIFIRSSRVYGNKRIQNISLRRNSYIAKDIDSSKLKRFYCTADFYTARAYHIKTNFGTFSSYLTDDDLLTEAAHCLIMALFLMFIFYNGSMVLGDKTAHQATIHLPQMLYFLLFYGFFGLPHVFVKIPETLRMIVGHKRIVVIYAVLMLLAVHFNTLAHPYLLADNRHYTFYIWNRWFGKYLWAKYATVPAYIFLVFNLYANLKESNCISFFYSYLLSFFLVLSFQRMIEVRYFLVPFIVLRLRFGRPSWKVVIFEFLWYLVINYVTFNLFFYKEIEWVNFNDLQRLIW